MDSELKCDACGMGIPIEDLDSGKATHVMATPDSAFTSETWNTTCADCNDESKWCAAAKGKQSMNESCGGCGGCLQMQNHGHSYNNKLNKDK